MKDSTTESRLKDFDPDQPGSVPSPCISVCRMDARSGLCEGCQRTMDEIAQWGTASEEWKRAAWTEIRFRRQARGMA